MTGGGDDDKNTLQSLLEIAKRGPAYLRPPTEKQMKLADSSALIALDGPDAIAFHHSVFCQAALPYKRCADRRWERRNGNVALEIDAGRAFDPDHDAYVDLPLPYGAKSRLIHMHLDSQAVRLQSANIEVEDSMTAFVQRLLQREPNGREIRTFKEQMRAVSGANYRIAYSGPERLSQRETRVVIGFDLWFPKDSRQRVLWPSSITLSPEYFDSLMEHAVPLDERAIGALADSAMALDIYKWLAQRLHRVKPNAPAFIPWTALHAQFGFGYARLRDFRAFFLQELRAVLTQYPEATVKVWPEDSKRQPEGLKLYNSKPPVPSRFHPARLKP